MNLFDRRGPPPEGRGARPAGRGSDTVFPEAGSAATEPGQALSSVPPPESSLSSRLVESLQSNPYFNAGAGLAGIGLAVGVARRAAIIGNAYFRRRFMTTLQINNEDPAYPWLLDFINRHSAQQTRNLAANTRVIQAESGKTSLNFAYLPGHGYHYFTYKWRWIKVDRQRERQMIQGPGGYRTPFETVSLTTLGSDSKFLKNMLEQAANEAVSSTETGLVVYHAAGPDWRRFGPPRRKRQLESVVLRGNTAQLLVDDFHEFVNSGKWYADRGVPYRRGYLLHGPPGTGKSSFISALAAHFGYSICMLSLSERTLDDDRLNHLLNTPPPNSVILLEDIDAAFGNREDPMAQHPAYQGMTRVTFSGLLNAIDGVGCAEERVLFMTTNHLDRLDAALIRPGRVDRQQLFDNADEDMIAKMFIRFYEPLPPESRADLVTSFVSGCIATGLPLSPAAIQGHLLMHKNDPEGAARMAKEKLGDGSRRAGEGA